jgi:hypothetical protein
VIGGWRVNGITTFRSGVPIALTTTANGLSQFDGGTPGFGPGAGGTIRPSYIPGCSKSAPGSPHSNAKAAEWFNTSCFTAPGNYSFGNEPRVDSTMKSQGLDNFDFSINKGFDITEQVKLKFAAEVFDIFNHAQFGLPGETQNTGSFGQVNHQTNLPRTIQLSLRLRF